MDGEHVSTNRMMLHWCLFSKSCYSPPPPPLGRFEPTSERAEHKSATCYVFVAKDRDDLDALGDPRPVAIKLMRIEAQFQREIEARGQGFDSTYVMPILRTYEPEGGATSPSAFDGVDMLTKEEAESFYALVMPMADRNLFVAIKQERFAGVDMHQVTSLSYLHIHGNWCMCVL